MWEMLKFNTGLCSHQPLESLLSWPFLLLETCPWPHPNKAHFSFFADKGELFVWGKNIRGCLGIGRLEDQYFPWRVRLDWAGFHLMGSTGSLGLPPFRVPAALLLCGIR